MKEIGTYLKKRMKLSIKISRKPLSREGRGSKMELSFFNSKVKIG